MFSSVFSASGRICLQYLCFLCKERFEPQHERVTVERCKATFSQVSFAFLAFLTEAVQ